MADPQPKPGEVQISQAALSSDDIGEVGEALSGLFAEDAEDEIQPQGQGSADGAEQEETPAIGDTETGHSEQEEAPAIEPPGSWTAEEKQQFAQLPPALQQTVLRRESERERLLSTQAQKASETERAIAAERQQLADQRAQQGQFLQAVLFQLYPEVQQFQAVDWNKLAREQPAEWAAKRQAFDDLNNRITAAQQQIGAIQQLQQAEQQKQFQKTLEGERAKLIEKLPEFADPLKRQAIGQDLAKHLPELTQQEIGSIADHRHFLIARDAVLWRQHQAALAAAQAKRVATGNGAASVRRLQPQARRSNAGEEAQARQLGALHENLRKSGSMQDAASLLAATGIFGKA